MNLRRKMLAIFIAIAVINGMATVFFFSFALSSGQEENTQSNRIDAFHIAVFFLSAVLQVISLWFATQRLLFRPLKLLANGAIAIAAGRPASLDIDRNDEIGEAANAINHMTESLRSTAVQPDRRMRRAVLDAENAMGGTIIEKQLLAASRTAIHMAQAVNTPLANMDALLNKLEWEKKYVLLQMTKRIRQAIDNGIKKSRRQPDAKAVRIAEPLRQALALLAEKMKTSNVTLSCSTEDTDKIRVIADPDDLCHVFYNLIENAIEAMPNGGTLTVKTECVYSWAVVEIVDTGRGLTIDEIAASFDYSYTTKTVGHGYGLGLSLSRNIIDGYNGSLTLNSHKGEGTRTAVELPIAQTAIHTPQ